MRDVENSSEQSCAVQTSSGNVVLAKTHFVSRITTEMSSSMGGGASVKGEKSAAGE